MPNELSELSQWSLGGLYAVDADFPLIKEKCFVIKSIEVRTLDLSVIVFITLTKYFCLFIA